jgi:hypothetical protein
MPVEADMTTWFNWISIVAGMTAGNTEAGSMAQHKAP